MKSNKKSQVIIYDFLAGFIVFVFIILFASIFWFKTSAQVDYDKNTYNMLRQARDVSVMLIKTSGMPERWELKTPEQCFEDNCTIGLVIDDNVISTKKLDAFLDLEAYDYDRLKVLLGLKKYEYYFRIIEVKEIRVEVGRNPLENLSVNIRRKVVINNTPMDFEFSIYRYDDH